MINFEEELKKFQPSLEVEDIEQAVYQDDLTDVTEIIKEVIIDQSTGQLPNLSELEAAQQGKSLEEEDEDEDAGDTLEDLGDEKKKPVNGKKRS